MLLVYIEPWVWIGEATGEKLKLGCIGPAELRMGSSVIPYSFRLNGRLGYEFACTGKA